jgi:hypothetical protein
VLRPNHGFSRAADVLELAIQYGVVRDGGPGVLIMPDGTRASKSDVMALDDLPQVRTFFDKLAERVKEAAGSEGPTLALASKEE